MSAYCVPCKRSFKRQSNLDQHIQDSSAHKNLQTASLVKLAKSQVLRPVTQTTTREQAQTPSAITSSSSTPQIIIPAVKTASQGVSWTVIVESECAIVLNALSAHCHTPMELEENGYIVHLYNSLDYTNSLKCKRCNSRFPY